jgi:hypothetical protein
MGSPLVKELGASLGLNSWNHLREESRTCLNFANSFQFQHVSTIDPHSFILISCYSWICLKSHQKTTNKYPSEFRNWWTNPWENKKSPSITANVSISCHSCTSSPPCQCLFQKSLGWNVGCYWCPAPGLCQCQLPGWVAVSIRLGWCPRTKRPRSTWSMNTNEHDDNSGHYHNMVHHHHHHPPVPWSLGLKLGPRPFNFMIVWWIPAVFC